MMRIRLANYLIYSNTEKTKEEFDLWYFTVMHVTVV